MTHPGSSISRTTTKQLSEYIWFAWDFFIARQNRPFVLGLVITDICNLSCKHCRVANIQRISMSFEEIRHILQAQFNQGIRYLYLEGGEPYLWQDGKYRLGDVIDLAKQIGYFRVHVYTNGTVPLIMNPDFTWVSIDGLGKTFTEIRGIDVEHVLRHIRTFHGKFGIVFTVNTINHQHIREFLAFMKKDFPGVRVMFYFHTPYYGVDYLLLSKEQKQRVIDNLIKHMKAGFPVMNSVAGLKAMASGNYFHPTNLWRVIDLNGEYQCCRAYGNPEVCENCGYSTCAEIVLARNWRVGPIWQLLNAY